MLPANDLGILVTTLLLSTVTVDVTPVGNGADVDEEGIVKFFGSQSSIKKPIVDASVGSTCGLTVVVSVGFGGGGAGVFFLSQEEKETTIKKAFIIKEIQAFEIIGDLFICNKNILIRFQFLIFVAGRRIGPQHFVLQIDCMLKNKSPTQIV